MPAKRFRAELDPNNKQRTAFARHAGVARFVWNWGLGRRIEEYKTTGKSSNAMDQHKQLNAIKESEFPWMYEVSSCVCNEALRNLDNAFKHFFRRCKEKKEKPGFPRFKGKKNGIGGFRIGLGVKFYLDSVYLPCIGLVRVKEFHAFPLGIKETASVTIKERAGRWFISVSVDEEITVVENFGTVVGIDLGLSSFATLSDGTKVDNPRHLNNSLRKLRRLSKSHSRKQKGSNNRRKATRKLAVLHYDIFCKRQDFLHKLSTKLAKTKSVIVVEDLKVSGMIRNKKLSKSISDVGWSGFVRKLEYKCQWYGSKLIKADRYYPSTKTCSKCGSIKEKMELSERVYCCKHCGLSLDRDINAAINLASLATARSAES